MSSIDLLALEKDLIRFKNQPIVALSEQENDVPIFTLFAQMESLSKLKYTENRETTNRYISIYLKHVAALNIYLKDPKNKKTKKQVESSVRSLFKQFKKSCDKEVDQNELKEIWSKISIAIRNGEKLYEFLKQLKLENRVLVDKFDYSRVYNLTKTEKNALVKSFLKNK